MTHERWRHASDSQGATRAEVIGTLLVLLVAATCIRLGFWQLSRLEERQARNAVVTARMMEPAVPLDRVPADDGAAYRRVRVTGSCEGQPLVLAARSRRGAPGAHLLCRFRTAAGDVILLDRGWLPSPDARTLPAAAFLDPPRDTTIEALLIPFPEGEAQERRKPATTLARSDLGLELDAAQPRVMYRLNQAEASAVAGIVLPAWYAQAMMGDVTGRATRGTGGVPGGSGPGAAAEAGEPGGGGPGAAAEAEDRSRPVRPIPAEPPDLSSGPHLGYAVQWFSFAAIGLIGWLVLLRRRPDARGPKRGSAAGPDGTNSDARL